jgi:hypothetical protein
VLDDPERRSALVEAGLERVARRYDAVAVAGALGDLYEQLLAER